MERTERMAELLDGLSAEDLRRTVVQAIDHAYKASAEVAEAQATVQGALGTIATLRAENEQLRHRLAGRGPAERSLEAVRTSAARSVRWARRRVAR
jgi:regulator of replication initiation timing